MAGQNVQARKSWDETSGPKHPFRNRSDLPNGTVVRSVLVDNIQVARTEQRNDLREYKDYLRVQAAIYLELVNCLDPRLQIQ